MNSDENSHIWLWEEPLLERTCVLQASVRCLASKGRLLEIGKYDILKGTSLSMRPLLQNIAFDGIDLDRVFNDPDDTAEASVSPIARQLTSETAALCCLLDSRTKGYCCL